MKKIDKHKWIQKWR